MLNDQVYDFLFSKAHAAAHKAASAVIPAPMIVGTAKSLVSNEIDYTKPVEVVSEGPCGFAWINIKPGNSGFAKWLKKNRFARKDEYYGGVTIWVSAYNQSMIRKETYAETFAEYVRTAGNINAYANSRMD